MPQKTDPVLSTLLFIFLSSLTYAGFLALRSIDYKILDKLESAPISLPTPILPTAEPSFTPTPEITPPHSSTN